MSNRKINSYEGNGGRKLEREREMATNDDRDGRRRRIAERGSDRMALITGRIQTLDSPSSPLASDYSHSRTVSAPPLRFGSQDYKESSIPNISHQRTVSVKGDYEPSASTLQKHDMGDSPSRGNSFDMGSQIQAELRKFESTREVMKGPIMEERAKIQPPGITPTVTKASTVTESLKKSNGNWSKLFTAKQINSCILASERTRVFCALIIAFLVVMSYIDYPLFGKNIVSSESVIASRPLYIVLLTDVTIVLARLFREKRTVSEEPDVEKTGPREEGHNWAGAVKLLEAGLVAYQSIRGIFIDCSVYAVVVICGLSFI